MEPKGFCSQELDTIPFLDPEKSSLQTTSHGSFIINFNIFLPYTPKSSKQCSSFRLAQEASYGSVVCPTRSTCTHQPKHFDLFYHKYVRWGVQFMKLFPTQFSAIYYYCLRLTSKSFLSASCSRMPPVCVFQSVWQIKYHIHTNKHK